MTIESDIEKTARTFSEVLLHAVGAQTLKTIIEKNDKELDPSICHSNDFIDANMAMDQAMKLVRIKEDSSRGQIVWNRAWDLAKKRRFYLPRNYQEQLIDFVKDFYLEFQYSADVNEWTQEMVERAESLISKSRG